MTLTSSSSINCLIEEIININNLQSNFLSISARSLSAENIAILEKYLDYCLYDEKVSLSYLAQCYDLIVKDTFNNQLYFKRNKKYKHSTYAEVESLVYRNDMYMSMYMYGLAITSFLWKNHADMKDFFINNLPKQGSGKYLEIGPGHGFHMMEAMKCSEHSNFLGVDISPSSVRLTNSILGSKYFGSFSNYEVKECDFLNWDNNEVFSTIVMGEVLEHVEKPQDFLRKIANLSDRNTHIHITTCINSPAIDHIYLFRDSQQVVDMVEENGLFVKKQLLVPYLETKIEQSESDSLPINIALILGKMYD